MPIPYAQRLQNASQPTSGIQSVTAPIGGWNTRDALDSMDPTDAVILDNWYPNNGGVDIRKGYKVYVTGLGGGAVKTLAEFNAGPIRKFLAGASGAIYDVSGGTGTVANSWSSDFSSDFGPTSVSPIGPPLGSGFSSDEWQTVPFLSRLFFCNGADIMQVFDGTTLSNATFTGVALNQLFGCGLYQNRLFFWQNSSTGFWFAPLNSISGILSFFDLAAFSPNGGNLIAMTTISHDGGAGVQDFAVFIMSSGDCLLYFGNDPSDSAAWQLVGIYRISPPVSPRAVCPYGADAFLTTADDHVPLQQQLVALKLGQLPPRSKISPSVQDAVSANGSAFGWQAIYYPRGRRLIFNIPNTDGTFNQHVQNTGQTTTPWCRFTGMNAQCWGLFRDSLYFGGASGTIYLADTGTQDLMGSISADGQQAWNNFETPVRKRMTAVRPVVQSVGAVNYAFGIGFDYGDINVPLAGVAPNVGSPWDVSPWDTSPWSPESQIDSRWRIGGGSGTSIGMRLKVQAATAISWLRTDLRFEAGNAL